MKFIIAAFLVLLLGVLYVGLRLLAPFDLSRRARVGLWMVLAVLLIGVLWFPLAMVLPVGLEGTDGEAARSWFVFTSMGALLLLGLALVARDLLWLLGWTVRWVGRRGDGSGGGSSEERTRRRFLYQTSSFGAAAAAGLLGAGAFSGARRRAGVARVTVAIDGLPSALDGFRIVQITDLHIGNTIRRPFVEAVVAGVNQLDGDLVAVTGDLTDGTVDMLRDEVAPMAALRARHGVFFVTGNHDYYFGDGARWVEEARRLGMISLVNEHRVIERDGALLVVAGVPDYRAGDYVGEHASDPAASLVGAPEGAPKILLAHQPRSAPEAAALGFDLQLSGHTHGGQVVPFHLVARLTQPVLSGLHRIDRTWLYVSRGTGYWGPPLRLGAPSEITVVTLRTAPAWPDGSHGRR